ncbi:Hypothetical protein R9X50_00265000 [Acrodontium crateriforme]|uniref:OsmC family protein n=1 Tax=Acrodontium crateriforme TaxID=150365 RepID=A0AAQ3M4N3_9PEZI|nr:Hypothetical protein R9X50_00265000 [Acrodontium crateriforme]
MSPTSLREKQAPLKETYRQNPSSALITLTQTGFLDSTTITCHLSSGKTLKEAHTRIAGLHPKAGGEDPSISGELCSGDLLLEALVACAGVTLKAVATALDIPVVDGTVTAEGDLDFRGTLGVDRETPVGFQAIRLGFVVKLESGVEVEEERIERLGRLTERYCVVLQSLVRKPEVRVSLTGRQEVEHGIERSLGWSAKS